jgi:hypothetical protein
MNKDIVFLVAGDPLSISTDIPDFWRKEVLSSLLYSRLYANSKVNRLVAPDQWYKNFSNAMGKVKWGREAYKSYSFEPEVGAVVALQDLVGARLGSLFGLSQAPQFERLMASVEDSLNTEVAGAKLRQRAVVSTPGEKDSVISTIALQLSFVGAGPVVYSAFVHFATVEDVEVDFINQRFLGEHIVGKVSIDVSKQLLDKAGYEEDRMQDQILSKLPDSTDKLIFDITSQRI